MSEFNIEVQGGSSVRLPTAGKYCDRDIIVKASGGGGWSLEGFVTGTEPIGDIVIGAITPKAYVLSRNMYITSLVCDGTIFNADGTGAFAYLSEAESITLKNTSGAMPGLIFAYASNALVAKIIGSCPLLPSNAFNGFGANYSIGQPVIYVPWAEDDPLNANAPWGATRATIKYNTTYDTNDNPITSEV